MNPNDHLVFDEATSTLHIEPVDGIEYVVGGKVVTGDVKLTKKTIVRARPRGRLFDEGAQTEWVFVGFEEPSVESEVTYEDVNPDGDDGSDSAWDNSNP